jgi:hypothetical protein
VWSCTISTAATNVAPGSRGHSSRRRPPPGLQPAWAAVSLGYSRHHSGAPQGITTSTVGTRQHRHPTPPTPQQQQQQRGRVGVNIANGINPSSSSRSSSWKVQLSRMDGSSTARGTGSMASRHGQKAGGGPAAQSNVLAQLRSRACRWRQGLPTGARAALCTVLHAGAWQQQRLHSMHSASAGACWSWMHGKAGRCTRVWGEEAGCP